MALRDQTAFHTKQLTTACLVFLAASAVSGLGQGFNLDFESAHGPSGNQPGLFPIVRALPFWSVFYGTNQASQIEYNDISTGATQATLVGPNDPYGPNSLEGNYSVCLQGGSTAADASIRQTVTIPIGTISIEFKAAGDITFGPMLLSFAGQNITYYALAIDPNYTLYGGDVSGFAGATGQLEFSVPGDLEGYSLDNAYTLDSIIFSTAPTPEPGTCGLILGGMVLFGIRRWSRE
jgi:hypothetical protein